MLSNPRQSCALIVVGVVLVAAWPERVAARQGAPGGFLESATSTATRRLFSATEIATFLPARGKFTFPAPYFTEGIRLTNETDCAGTGFTDCVHSVGYSYWRNINNHVGSDTMLVFLGIRGRGPTLFGYHKPTGQVTNHGPLFPAGDPFTAHSGEGFYFSATQPYALYVWRGSKMWRYHVVNRTYELVYDLATRFGGGYMLWQPHSSNNDNMHSFTLRDTSSYAMLGCVVYKASPAQWFWFPQSGMDECQIDKSGKWLLIKAQVDGLAGEDNRIINLETGVEKFLADQDGAAGHSDIGYEYNVADDNFASLPGSTRVWKFNDTPMTGPQVYHMVDWGAGGVGHYAHANARSGVPLEQQYVCGGGATTKVAPRANEIVCFRLDTSLQVLVVAQNMTNLNALGGGDSYTKLPKGNIDVTGEYFIWASNMGGNRNDAFIVRVPAHLLGAGPPPPPPPADTTPPVLSAISATGISGTSATISWTTNEPSTTQVEYGPTTSYGSSTVLDPNLVTSHNQTLGGLAPNTLYHYRVKSRDAAGNVATSADFTFTTAPADARTGLLAHWTLDEGAGTIAGDASGNGRTATLIGGASWTSGRTGQAVSLNGSGQYGSAGNPAVFNAYPLSVSTWIKTNSTTGVRGIVNKYMGGSYNGWNLFMRDGRICAWYLRDGSNYVYDGSGCTFNIAGVNDNEWHHVVYVVDAAGGRIFVDGVQKGTQPWTGTAAAPATAQDVRLGHYPGAFGGAEYFAGGIDEVRIYGRALTAADVTSLYTLPPAPPPPPPPWEALPPQNLKGTVSASTVTLTWTPPNSGTPTSYVLEVGSKPGASDLIPGFVTNSLATTFVALAPPGTYIVRLKALYGSQLSAASNEIAVVVGSGFECRDSPSAPTGFRFSSFNSMLTLSWNAAGGDVTSYVLAAGSRSGATNLGSVDTGAPVTTFAAVVPPGRYYVSVRGRNACGLGPAAEVVVDVP